MSLSKLAAAVAKIHEAFDEREAEHAELELQYRNLHNHHQTTMREFEALATKYQAALEELEALKTES